LQSIHLEFVGIVSERPFASKSSLWLECQYNQ
jgi:hypothetical protein